MGYRGKVREQAQARVLRANGWTLTEIAAEVGASKSSVSLWVRDVEIDADVLARRRYDRWLKGNEGARRRGPNKLQRAKQEEIDRFLAEGRDRIGRLNAKEFLVAGAALYAAEGSKRDGAITFPNSDPRMMLFFATWLRAHFEIDEQRLRVRLYLHEGLDLDRAENFWSELLRVPRRQFVRAYRAPADPTIRTTKHEMGCPALRYSSAPVHRAVMGLVTALLACNGSIPG